MAKFGCPGLCCPSPMRPSASRCSGTNQYFDQYMKSSASPPFVPRHPRQSRGRKITTSIEQPGEGCVAKGSRLSSARLRCCVGQQPLNDHDCRCCGDQSTRGEDKSRRKVSFIPAPYEAVHLPPHCSMDAYRVSKRGDGFFDVVLFDEDRLSIKPTMSNRNHENFPADRCINVIKRSRCYL